jgi:hypothetical protein
LPEYNRQLRLHSAEYAAVLQAVEAYYGRGARGTLIRVGRCVFEQMVTHQRWQTWQHRVAFLTLAPPARALRAVRWLADEIAVPAGRVEVEGGPGGLVMLDYEGDGVFGRQRDAPGCWLTVGKLQGAVHWATGREYEVVETECRGTGSPACRFEIKDLRL